MSLQVVTPKSVYNKKRYNSLIKVQTQFKYLNNPMKNKATGFRGMVYLCSVFLLALAGCGGGNKGQLVGVQGREKWYQADPYGMVYIPAGSYNMGPSDQDVPYALTAQSKSVTVPAFWMDNTEI